MGLMRGMMGMIVAVAAAALATTPAATAAWAAAEVRVEEVAFDALVADVDGSSIRRAVVTDGLFQVTGVPQLKALRKATFGELVECMASMKGGAPSFYLADETVRRTFAAVTEHGQRHAFNLAAHFGAEALSAECIAFERSATALRELISRVSTLVFAQLDALCGTRQAGEFFAMHASGEPYASAQSFLNAGVHLEHFHAYQANCSASALSGGAAALDMHTDAGLFIALLPSAFVDARSAEPIAGVAPGLGFMVENAHGKVGRPALAEDGDVVLFMIGQGMTELAHRCVPMRPVPHALVMQPACALGDVVRAWYGRMFLPPADGINENTGRTFGEDLDVRASAVAAHGEAFAAGCSRAHTSDSLLVARDLADGCGADASYCWHQCMEFSEDSGCTSETASEDILCEGTDGTIWSPTAAPTDHCPTCQPYCFTNSTPETNTAGMCNGYGTVMYMFGFASSVDPAENCVSILFPAFTLDTPGKMVAGAIGVFLFGMMVELIIYVRRYHLKVVQDRWKHWQNVAVYMFMYVVQVTAGYFAMLIVMTYSAILFVAVVLGLAAGHFCLNMNLRNTAGQAADPCCQFAEEIDDAPVDLNHKVAAKKSPPQEPTSSGHCCGSKKPVEQAQMV